MQPLPCAGCAPFEDVTVTRVLDDLGDATEWVRIEGLRDGQVREVRVRYAALLEQADVHLRFHHGKSLDDPMDLSELSHATMRAAVAFLMD